MAKTRRARGTQRKAQLEPASVAAVRSTTEDEATQLAAAQQRVADLSRTLKKKVEVGTQALRAIQAGQTDGEEALDGAATRSTYDALTSPTLPLNLLRRLAAEEPGDATALVDEQTKKAQEVVDFYSLVAAGVGLVPGVGLSFAGVFATQVIMVRDIAAAFGRDWSMHKTSTAVTALLGAGFGLGIGNFLNAVTLNVFPSTIGGVLGVLANPVASYSTAQAVGSVFISQFQNENRHEVTRGLANQLQQSRSVRKRVA